MYTIYCDNYILHADIPDYQLLTANLTMETNTAGSLEFQILPDHPNIAQIAKLKSEIKVVKNGETIWKGRSLDDQQSLDTTHKMYCEGKLKVLDDSIIRPGVFDDSADNVFEAFITEHNSQVESWQQINIGNVWTTETVYREFTTYESTYTRLLDLVSSLGGYLVFRYEEDGDYLDWVEDFTVEAEQAITLGENMLDLTKETSADTLYTVCIPLGEELKDESGNLLGGRLTIESLEDVDYIVDEELVAQYGWIVAPISDTTWDDITTAKNLLAKGQAYLAAHNGDSSTLEITALDLAYTDIDIESFNFCEYINVTSSVHGILAQYLLSKIEIDITNPANDKITLGGSIPTFTDSTNQIQQSVTGATNNVTNTVVQLNSTKFGPADVATQSEAEAGTLDTKVMTPLKTKYAIDALASGTDIEIATQAEAEAGTDDTKMMTPLKTKYAIDELGESMPVPKSGTGTIGTTGWVSNTGDYAYKLNIAITGIESSDVIMVSINPDVMDVANTAELCQTIDSYAGGITVYAKTVPAESIGFSYFSVITTSQTGGDFTKGISYRIDGNLALATGLCGQHAPLAMTVKEIIMSADTAPTGADLIIDINKNGTTMYTTQANRPKILDGETTATVLLPNVVSIAKGDKIAIDIDRIGSTSPGAGLSLVIICEV